MQTKQRSLLEVCCNVGSGIITAYLTWIYIITPWIICFNINLNKLEFMQVIALNGVFTIVSVVRGYVWRRWFNIFD